MDDSAVGSPGLEMNSKDMKNSTKEKNKNPVIVAVSGGFDPMHVGHIRMLQAAKERGDFLIVILNNDHWLKDKKGFVFMSQDERAEILQGCRFVDAVYITGHKKGDKDCSVCKALKVIKPDIFANGGDRKRPRDLPESALCKRLGIKMEFNIGGGKVQSSSWLTAKVPTQSKKI